MNWGPGMLGVPGMACPRLDTRLLPLAHWGGCSSTLMITTVGHRVLPLAPGSSLFLPLTIRLSHLSLSAAAHHQPDVCRGGGEAGRARDERRLPWRAGQLGRLLLQRGAAGALRTGVRLRRERAVASR